jgi:hypothetical protein
VLAQTPARSDTADVLTEMQIIERITTAIDRAMEYLAGQQRPDGGWHDNNAVNAVAILSYLGRGHTPGRGPYRETLDRGKRFIVSCAKETGFLGFKSMYEHGLATLALAELYGMDPDPEVEEKLRKAVDLIVKCQHTSGGWRYQPAPNDADLSVSVMQIVALRAANNAEVPVPAETLEKAVKYVLACTGAGGGYSYQPGAGANPQASAAGTLCLQLLGQYNDPTVPKALAYLSTLPIKWGAGPTYFYYFHYYAVQAHYQAGGKPWNEWHPRIRELLLSKQDADGSWDLPPGTHESASAVGPNKVYSTAMASLVLEIYMHFLPAYQR